MHKRECKSKGADRPLLLVILSRDDDDRWPAPAGAAFTQELVRPLAEETGDLAEGLDETLPVPRSSRPSASPKFW